MQRHKLLVGIFLGWLLGSFFGLFNLFGMLGMSKGKAPAKA